MEGYSLEAHIFPRCFWNELTQRESVWDVAQSSEDLDLTGQADYNALKTQYMVVHEASPKPIVFLVWQKGKHDSKAMHHSYQKVHGANLRLHGTHPFLPREKPEGDGDCTTNSMESLKSNTHMSTCTPTLESQLDAPTWQDQVENHSVEQLCRNYG